VSDLAHPIEFELIETDEGLRALQPEWDELYARARPANPFLSFSWTRICREQIGGYSRPWVLLVRREGRLAGIAPLRLERRLGFRVLRFIGDGRSDYLGFLEAADEVGVRSALLEELSRRRSQWDVAVLRQLAGPYTALSQAGAPKTLRAHGILGTTAPFLAEDLSWDELLARGPGWLKRMAKAARKWEKEGGTVARYVGAEASAHAGEVAAVEARSWKARQGVARFQPGRGQALLRSALDELGARGEMELWIARMDGRPSAFEINFLPEGKLWLYQGTYDEEFYKRSPGGVLDFLSIQRAWSEGRREYDFLSGDEPYKLERTNAARSIQYLALHPYTARGVLAFNTLVAPRWRLKNVRSARSALGLWVQVRNNPAALLPAPMGRYLRPLG